jgi:hypothetical protein
LYLEVLVRCPLTAAVRADAIDRDHPVRFEAADDVAAVTFAGRRLSPTRNAT